MTIPEFLHYASESAMENMTFDDDTIRAIYTTMNKKERESADVMLKITTGYTFIQVFNEVGKVNSGSISQ